MPVEDGYVPTPAPVADYAAAICFGATRPGSIANGGRLLLPGLGTGNLYDAVVRYCTAGENWHVPEFEYPLPDEIVGVELNAERLATFEQHHPDAPIETIHGDFLLDPPAGKFDWVLANPPYTRYKNIAERRRERYAERFDLAQGQFHLYTPFFEQAFRLLKDDGYLLFILPLSLFGAKTEAPLRNAFRACLRGPIRYLPECTFDQTVSPFLLGIQKTHCESNHFWLEPIAHTVDIETIVAQLGVENVETTVSEYRESCRTWKQWVRAQDKRERKSSDTTLDTPLFSRLGASSEGGERETTPAASSNADHQAGLGEFA